MWSPAPASYTGEDVAELQLHGSRAVLRALFDSLAEQGARPAEAGEFSRRAFVNGKLDLTELEGLADLIAAETEMQRRQALAQARGSLAERAEAWRSMLIDLRAELEARLDFSDEGDVPEALPAALAMRWTSCGGRWASVLAGAAAGERVREGFRVAILGPPNAGKSSLLNAIAKRDVAIVTEEAGTTRDVLEVPLDLGGYPVLLFDTAGLREADSLAEREGVRRARAAGERADLVLWLQDCTASLAAAAGIRRGSGLARPYKGRSRRPSWRLTELPSPSVTGEGLPALIERVGEAAAAVSRRRECIGDPAQADGLRSPTLPRRSTASRALRTRWRRTCCGSQARLLGG